MIALALAVHVAFGAIALDASAKHINAAASTTCAITITASGTSDLLVLLYNSDTSDTNPTASGASLSWTRLNLRNSTSTGGSAYADAAFYAQASGALSAQTITVSGASGGHSCALWAFSGAGTAPTNWTTGIQGTPSAEQLTITAGTGSWLVGISQDNTTAGNVAALANTTLTQGSGTASNWYVAWETKTSISGSTTFGSSQASDDYASAAVEVPAASGGGGGATLHTLTTLGVGN